MMKMPNLTRRLLVQSGSKRAGRHARPRFAREQRELRGFSVCQGCIALTFRQSVNRMGLFIV